MTDSFVFPCTKPPRKRPFWKPKPNYSWEYAGGSFGTPLSLDFESIPDYPHDRAQWMSSQTQFQLTVPLERLSPFSMSSALPLLKAGSSRDVWVTGEPPALSTTPTEDGPDLVPDLPDLPTGRGQGQPLPNALFLSPIPEAPWAKSPPPAERFDTHPAGQHVLPPDSLEEDASFDPPPVLMPGLGSYSSTHSGLTSDSAPRTPSIEAQRDEFPAYSEDYRSQPDGFPHEEYPPAPHSYISSPLSLLRDSWNQLVAQSYYVSATESAHGTELRSNRPPSTVEETGENWAGKVPQVWSLFSETPTLEPVALPPSPVPVPPIPQPPRINPIFARILWDVRFPPASASLMVSKPQTMAFDDDNTRALSRLEVLAPATSPPTQLLLVSSPHTRWRAHVKGETLPGGYVSVADVLHALHDQLALRFVKQTEWDKLNPRTQWFVGRAYGRNRLSDMSDAGSVDSEFGGGRSSTGGQSMAGSIWSEGSRMSGESVNGGPGAEWGPGIRRADVLRDRAIFAGLKFDPAYKRLAHPEQGTYHLVMDLRKYERDASQVSA